MTLIRKICINYGPRAFDVLGPSGYIRYLGVTLRNALKIASEGNLRPVDRGMSGVVRLKHRVSSASCFIDLESYRSGDMEEGSFAFGLLREIWLRDIYFRQFALPPRLESVIDLGANRGIFTVQAAAVAAQVISVEALDKYWPALQHNLALNGFENVQPIQAMVGGQALLDGTTYPTITLAELLALASGAVDFLKVDIEGSEFGLDLRVLTGVKRVAMEMHPRWGNTGKLVAEIAALGFDCRTFDESLAPVPAEHADFVLAINTRHPDARWAA